jgi:hypothetical protein
LLLLFGEADLFLTVNRCIKVIRPRQQGALDERIGSGQEGDEESEDRQRAIRNRRENEDVGSQFGNEREDTYEFKGREKAEATRSLK